MGETGAGRSGACEAGAGEAVHDFDLLPVLRWVEIRVANGLVLRGLPMRSMPRCSGSVGQAEGEASRDLLIGRGHGQRLRMIILESIALIPVLESQSIVFNSQVSLLVLPHC